MTAELPLVLRAWRQPSLVATLSERAWEQLLAEARRVRLLGRLAAHLDAAGMLAGAPPGAQRALSSEQLLARHEARVARWEVACLEKVLGPVCGSLILLKGAAYQIAGLEVANGRISSDVDLLLAKDDLPVAEQALLTHGWRHVKLEPYDQLYYREWTHELPPLQHAERETFVDVHHGILPVTSRLKPHVPRLHACARALDGEYARWKVLSPEHMVLHSAVHGFHDGELDNPIADILDVHQLVSEFFLKESRFIDRLFEEARVLGLSRPLRYALRAALRYFGTSLPSHAIPPSRSRRARQVESWLDTVVRRSVRPASERPSAAATMLYLRSHWLRMPPALLARHLTVKLFTRRKPSLRPDLVARA